MGRAIRSNESPALLRRIGKHLKVETSRWPPHRLRSRGLIRLWQCLGKWVEKRPNKDEGGEGDEGREDGSDDEDEESGEVDLVPILDNDNEVWVIESVEDKEYKQRDNFDSVNTPPAEEKNNEGVDFVIEEVVKHMMKQGYGHCDSIEGHEAVIRQQQSSDLLRSFLDELKAKVENRLDRIGNFLISLDGRVQHINCAISKTGGDVGAGMQTVHKDMSTLLKKATELGKKVETSRKMMKEFIDRLGPIVEECDKAMKNRSVHKKWKSKYQPNKGNHDYCFSSHIWLSLGSQFPRYKQ
ncbi:hypothetical protein Scep_004054 [Stephania cephalantha]|uniref:Uncharacterized protein n=1 Tax=Stephania cephalantha TaxID=152367 RepID=A0AAP0PWB6_9MAGN